MSMEVEWHAIQLKHSLSPTPIPTATVTSVKHTHPHNHIHIIWRVTVLLLTPTCMSVVSRLRLIVIQRNSRWSGCGQRLTVCQQWLSLCRSVTDGWQRYAMNDNGLYSTDEIRCEPLRWPRVRDVSPIRQTQLLITTLSKACSTETHNYTFPLHNIANSHTFTSKHVCRIECNLTCTCGVWCACVCVYIGRSVHSRAYWLIRWTVNRRFISPVRRIINQSVNQPSTSRNKYRLVSMWRSTCWYLSTLCIKRSTVEFMSIHRWLDAPSSDDNRCVQDSEMWYNTMWWIDCNCRQPVVVHRPLDWITQQTTCEWMRSFWLIQVTC